MKEDFTPVGTNNTNIAVYVFHHCRQAYQMVVGDRSDEEEGSGRLVCVPFSARMNSAGRDALLLCLSTMPREWFIGPATLENAYYKQNSSKKKSEAAQQDRQKCVETILHRIEEKYAPTTGDREGRRKAVEAKLFKEPFPVLSFLVYGLQAKSLFAPKL
ncbi:hypothetical protein ADEAN_000521200 [Angomonas deanei]|uniref:Uncharacterized protein n=1 Tax=Angomonas deanei TaxID=59799 RepID=A0A7G2CHN8_9TRYP|nr:hypothetical protein ADEAN_000521200 [Angomonas deanei]